MATQVTGAGGTTTSFSNTPQAKDDLFLLSENDTGVLILNVLANDLGGAAKQLYSIDNADSVQTATKILAPADLLTRDATYSGGVGGGTDTSYLGAHIWIGTDGTIHYDTANLESMIQALGAGEVLTDKVTYAIQLGNGTLSWATATIQFTGTNDKPDIHLVTTDSATASLIETNAPLTVNGTLTVNDADISDTVTAMVTSVSLGGTMGGLNSAAVLGMLTVSPISLTANPGETNNLGWTFNSAPQAFDFLAVGETLTLTYTITANDGHTGGTDTQTLTITIHGTDDAPVAVADTGSANEAGITPATAATGNVLANDTDVDNTHAQLSVSAVTGGTVGSALAGSYGSVTINGDGSYNYVIDDANPTVDALNVGGSLTDSFTYTVSDGQGGTSSTTLTITIHGTDDAPIAANDTSASPGAIAATEKSGTLNGSGGNNGSGNVLTNDSDVDSASLTVSSIRTGGAEGGGTAGSLGVGLVGAHGTLTIAANGSYTYVVNENDSTVQALNTGGSTTDTFNYTVSDGSLTDMAVLTVTINGANDAPVIDLNGGLAGTSTSLSYTTGSAATAIAPSGTVADVDSADFNGGSLTVAFTANGTSADQLTIQNQGTGLGQIGFSGSNVTYSGTTIGTFTGGTNGTNLVVTFNANATQAAAQALEDHIRYSNATSATTTKTVTFTLVDGDGGTDTGTATATINVTGGDTTAPNIALITGVQGNAGAPSTLVVQFSETGMNHTFFDSTKLALSNNVTLVSTTGTWGTATDGGGNTVDTYTLLVNKPNNGTTYTATFSAGAFKDGAGNLSTAGSQIGLKPAGTSGEPINLALTDPSHEGALITVTVKDVPLGWTIDGATHNADGSWTTQTSDLHGLTVTTPASFTGAAVLDVQLTWTNADGTTGSASIADNVEAYAPGSPIFAWSGDDVLTGSSGNDLFVFSQPIGADTVHNFDAAADQIDLIGYNGLANFADLQT
ncbi:hypothetical protein EN974_22975, partial [Mesorhizobium sp. M7A.F.Ca.CA.001.12.2.1]|uniref:beta strand repeat-containing protein n=1 Tax=Mesorhizobium sp. M7A.F.Ca.CA.001.12.2.1 TaxID=2496725 RepID=UPI000FD301AE